MLGFKGGFSQSKGHTALKKVIIPDYYVNKLLLWLKVDIILNSRSRLILEGSTLIEVLG